MNAAERLAADFDRQKALDDAFSDYQLAMLIFAIEVAFHDQE